jgi:hypothetical protein
MKLRELLAFSGDRGGWGGLSGGTRSSTRRTPSNRARYQTVAGTTQRYPARQIVVLGEIMS